MSDQSQTGRTARTTSGRFRRIATKTVIALVAVGAVVAIAMMPQPSREVPPTEAPPVNVSVMTIVPEAELADTFVLPAVVEPNRVVAVAAEEAAAIERIPPKEGDTVQKGDLLVQLKTDRSDRSSRWPRRYKRDQIEYERMMSLVKDDAAAAGPGQRRDATAASRATFEEARPADRTRILSPVQGVLNDLLVEQGEYVSPGTAVAELPRPHRQDCRGHPREGHRVLSVGRDAEILAEVRVVRSR